MGVRNTWSLAPVALVLVQSVAVLPQAEAAKSKRSSTNQKPAAKRAPSNSGDAALRAALYRRRTFNFPHVAAVPAAASTAKAPSAPKPEMDSTAIAVEQAASARAGMFAARSESQLQPDRTEALIREALLNRGKPYVWGGSSSRGFDCSGFVCYLFYREHGIKLPHSAAGQSRLGTPVPQTDLQAGDLVFFNTNRRGISHVGIFIGENRFIHAANSRKDVRIDSLSGYYLNRFKGARRIAERPIKFAPADLENLQQRLEQSEVPADQPAGE